MLDNFVLFSHAVYLLSQTSSALKEREQRMALAVCALVKERTENNGASLTTTLIEPALGSTSAPDYLFALGFRMKQKRHPSKGRDLSVTYILSLFIKIV